MPKAPTSTHEKGTASPARSRVPTSIGLAVTAASGFGKTTLLERLALEPGALLLKSDAAQRRISDGGRRGNDLATPGGEPLRHLVIDEFDRLRPPAQRGLMHELGNLGRDVAVSIASRAPIPDDLRNRLQRSMVDCAPVDLCLDAQEVADTLAQEYDVDDSLAERVHHLTAGWPELVHLTGLALRSTSAAASLRTESLRRHLLSPSARIAAWCHSDVLDTLPSNAVRALRLASWLGPVAPELICEVDRAAGDGAAVRGLAWLEQVGLVLPALHAWRAEITMGRVVPLLAAVVRAAEPPPHQELEVAARWYAAHDLPLPAAHAWRAAGDADRCRQTLIERGPTILGSGGASELIALAGGVEDAPRALGLLVGEALRVTGDMTAAHRTLTAAVRHPAAPDAALAWRLGMVHYARADYSGAVAVCQPTSNDPERTPDGVRMLATRACARFMLGQQVAGEQDADRALELATDLDDDRAVAAARLASGMVSTGARRDDHLAAALLAAQQSGDATMAARVLLNQAGNLLVDAEFREAAEVAERAVEAAGWGSPPATRACATHNLGEALTRLGKFQDAAVAFRRSVRIYRSHGLARTPAAMWGLAEIDRQRGRLDEARAAYAEVVDLASDTSEMQVLIPALLGWVRCLGQTAVATAADDESTSPGLAAELDRLTRVNATAQRCTLQVFAPALRTISGWLALCDGDRRLASSQVAEALAAARGQRNRVALADALELMAELSTDDRARRSALTELEAIWRSGGANPAADQVLVRLAGLPGAEPGLRADAKAALRRLTTAGVRVPGSGPGEAEPASSVRVRVLGSFEVRVNGREVPHAAWRSKQARSLLKILAAARGRPLTRDHLCEALWPDDLSDKTGHRLSVLLSAVRNVLDPDRRCTSDHYLRTDHDAVRLNLRHVRLDLEELLRDAREADALARRGQQHRAQELLSEVEAVYRGEAFEDEPYEQWAEIPREEARAAWSGATRLAARLAQRAGHADLAVGHLVRLLSSDPYDADVHRTLVDLLLEVGRHGEARRRLQLWTKAMHEIGAPQPDHRLANAGSTDPARRRRSRVAEHAPGRRADPLLTPR